MSSTTLLTVDPRTAPADCKTMAEVRQGVAALDRALVTLLAERQGYMHAAARIDDEVAKVKAAATQACLSHAIAEPVWRMLISRCIAHEFDVWDQTREEAKA